MRCNWLKKHLLEFDQAVLSFEKPLHTNDRGLWNGFTKQLPRCFSYRRTSLVPDIANFQKFEPKGAKTDMEQVSEWSRQNGCYCQELNNISAAILCNPIGWKGGSYSGTDDSRWQELVLRFQDGSGVKLVRLNIFVWMMRQCGLQSGCVWKSGGATYALAEPRLMKTSAMASRAVLTLAGSPGTMPLIASFLVQSNIIFKEEPRGSIRDSREGHVDECTLIPWQHGNSIV